MKYKLFVLFIQIIFFMNKSFSYEYLSYSYENTIKKLYQLKQDFPNYIEILTAQEMYMNKYFFINEELYYNINKI